MVSLSPGRGKGKAFGMDEEEQDMEQRYSTRGRACRERAGGASWYSCPRAEIPRYRGTAAQAPYRRALKILPLYARLSFEEQARVFRPRRAAHRARHQPLLKLRHRCPDPYVIDTGLARVNRYSWRNKVAQLQVEKSRAPPPTSAPGAAGGSQPRMHTALCGRGFAAAEYTEPRSCARRWRR